MSYDDLERLKFLEQLAHSNLHLTEWEARFVDELLESDELEGAGGESLTLRQREKIDQMRKRYQREL